MPALSREVGREIGVHIGVASGQVVASGTGSDAHREYTVTGETVNLASRLTDRAGGGEILISDAVRRALPAPFACSELGALAVKGLAKPVTAWRLSGVDEAGRRRAARSSAGAPSSPSSAARSRPAARAAPGQTIHLRGEAGIGKTRLVEELQRGRGRGLRRPHRPRPRLRRRHRSGCDRARWCAACSARARRAGAGGAATALPTAPRR